MKMWILILLLLPAAFAWNCNTHTYICDNAGLSEYDCCAADRKSFQKKHDYTSFQYHHCKDNLDDCNARSAAEKYMNKPDSDRGGIVYHLLADAMTPVHWWTTDYNKCHSQFEKLVDERLSDDSNWTVSYHCKLKNATVLRITMNRTYLDHISEYIVNYTSGISANKYSKDLLVEDCTEKCGIFGYLKMKLRFLRK